MIDLTIPEPTQKRNKFTRDPSEKNTYANAAVINHINEKEQANQQRPPKELPSSEEKSPSENKIPVAAVKPSLNPNLTPPLPKRQLKEEPSMYENVTPNRASLPIPVDELEGYVQDLKKTDSLKQEYAVSIFFSVAPKLIHTTKLCSTVGSFQLANVKLL